MSVPLNQLEDTSPLKNDDPTAAERKRDHIQLAFDSQVTATQLDDRFDYEPLLAGHPQPEEWPAFPFMGKTMRVPLWVSSMTGGTEMAHRINHNLARACAEFGMGMGLGSCRPLLYDDDRFDDFNIRPVIGDEQLLFANLGVAQLEQLLERQELWRLSAMIEKLKADGLIIHVNPMQEWLQPEGDRFQHPPLLTIKRIIEALPELAIIVKEVGQGMGRESLRALLQLPLAAIDFAANGGTNFAKLELLRSDPMAQQIYAPLAQVGHSATEMTELANELITELGDQVACRHIIISGGIQTFLDGYYLTERLHMPAIYGQASAFLRYARGDYEALQQYTAAQVRGLVLARTYLRPRA
jgi:isopentenyl-diphosphate delta-isomerase